MSIDFGNSPAADNWRVVNDDVMGGRSSSSLEYSENSVRFRGNLSLENNGGFASFRGPVEEMDLSGYEKVRIRFRSSGKAFGLRLSTSLRFYRPVFKHMFSSTSADASSWEEVEFQLDDFGEYVLGRPTGRSIGKADLRKVLRIGIMLSDKQEGPFDLEVDYIEFLR